MTPDSELAWTPGWRLREMFAGRELSPLEFADFLLARVEAHADLGAFVTVFADHYREQAKAATGAYAKGDTSHPSGKGPHKTHPKGLTDRAAVDEGTSEPSGKSPKG